MAKLTKRQKAIAAAVEANKVYTLEEAVQVLNSLPAAKFKESLDISVNLGVDPRKSDQVVRGATTLPAGTGKTVRVAVFAQGAAAEAAKKQVQMLLDLMTLLKAFKVEILISTWLLLLLMQCALLVS